jgi:hypothetical protein
MMTAPVAGIDPHQDTYTIGVVDPNGVELAHESFPTSASGYLDGIELLTTHSVEQVGIGGSAGWGAHAAIALVAAGFDCREVPANYRLLVRERLRRTARDHRLPRRFRSGRPHARTRRDPPDKLSDGVIATIPQAGHRTTATYSVASKFYLSLIVRQP